MISAVIVQITMVSRKIDIQVMKSVGATNTFICWPFMIEGVIIGIVAAVLVVVAVVAVIIVKKKKN